MYYYRLKQVDFDGHFEYSKIVTIQPTDDNKQITVYPSPVGHGEPFNVRLFATSNRLNLQIKNVDGRTVKAMQLYLQSGWQTLQLDVKELLPGNYIIQLQDGQVARFTKIKE